MNINRDEMNIQGLDYNTQREPLLMPEYGREIQKMIDYAIGLENREERQACALTIIRMMSTKVPQLRDNVNFQQTLWDHLYLMSNKQLDIEWPYDMKDAANIQNKPQPMKLPQDKVRVRHYGHLVQQLLEKLATMEYGRDRDELIRLTANQMKRDLILWGHGSNEDERVADDMARLTDGKVQLDLNTFRFDRIQLPNEEPKSNNRKRKK
jgi:hypothetical protein